jgi:hypothetical protein
MAADVGATDRRPCRRYGSYRVDDRGDPAGIDVGGSGTTRTAGLVSTSGGAAIRVCIARSAAGPGHPAASQRDDRGIGYGAVCPESCPTAHASATGAASAGTIPARCLEAPPPRGAPMSKLERIRRLVAGSAACAAVAVVAPARASDGDDVSKQAAQVAEESFNTGLRLMKQGEYQRAWFEFTKANAIYPRGAILRNLGVCELLLNRPLDAIKHFRAALASPDIKPDQRAPTQHDLDEMYRITGHIAVHSSQGAKIAIDGHEVAWPSSDPIDVMPGTHLLEARMGEAACKTDVNAAAGVLTDARCDLPAPAAVLPPKPAAPPDAVSSPPAAETPATPSPAGSRFWTTQRVIGAGIGGVGLALLAAGGVFQGQAIDAKNRSDAITGGLSPSTCAGANPPSVCADLSSARSSWSQNTTLSEIFFVGGGVATAAGLAVFLWPSSRSHTAGTTVEPVASPFGGGLRLRGEF